MNETALKAAGLNTKQYAGLLTALDGPKSGALIVRKATGDALVRRGYAKPLSTGRPSIFHYAITDEGRAALARIAAAEKPQAEPVAHQVKTITDYQPGRAVRIQLDALSYLHRTMTEMLTFILIGVKVECEEQGIEATTDEMATWAIEYVHEARANRD